MLNLLPMFQGKLPSLPYQRLNDIVGSAYYVAPEVLHRMYSVEADMWSIGVITYILLCGSRPFWARSESGIFRSVLRADPNFSDSPWPAVSPEAKDFARRLLSKDPRKRMTAAQCLTHRWLRDENCAGPLDILIYKLVKSYLRATPFKRAALKVVARLVIINKAVYDIYRNPPNSFCSDIFYIHSPPFGATFSVVGLPFSVVTALTDLLIWSLMWLQALSKALTEDELIYLRAQFRLLEPKTGRVSLSNFKAMDPLAYKDMEFEEFCAAAISVYQLEAIEEWETIASTAFEYFEQEGNRPISVEELALEMNVAPAAYSVFNDCIRNSDGKLSYIGYTKFLHGVTIRNTNTRRRPQ
ncbi:hypothetical protein Patl1_05278 [Pistacia atlantica]|uniref:Uncharacterized protein n=1 Tax=Pistacia atlantica TaxID=434234 RepID=A0ACC1BVZ5_9ROSI|nr:hypothetical protein Patl1_05278 [Pistacia atlantica]